MNEQAVMDKVMLNPETKEFKNELWSGRLSDDTLIENILSDLRSGADLVSRHHLVLADAGLGKTRLLRHLNYLISQDPVILRQFIVLDLLNVSDTASNVQGFWQSCLNALPSGLSKKVERKIDTSKNPTGRGKRGNENELLTKLLGCVKLDNRRLLLFVDDIHILLARFKQRSAMFMDCIASEPDIVLVSACLPVVTPVGLNDAIAKNIFKLYKLRNFSESEGFSTMMQLAEHDHANHMKAFLNQWAPRKERLYVLTHGNPRSTVAIYNVLAAGIDGNIRDPLEESLDKISTWYRTRLETLGPNERKILNLIAIHWEPIHEQQIASKLGLSRNSVVKGLKALNHLLIKTKSRSKQSNGFTFCIRERLFNIWYLRRVNSGMPRKFIWLVKFLKLAFSDKELQVRARLYLATPPGDLRESENYLVLAQTLSTVALKNALEYKVLQTSIIDDLSRDEFFQLYAIGASVEKMYSKLQYIRQLRSIQQNVAKGVSKTDIQLESFCDCLLGSPCLSLKEKQLIGDKAQELSENTWKNLEYFLFDEAKNWRRLLKAHSGPLYQSIRSGEMTSLSDTLGVESAAEQWQDPVLSAISWDAWLEIKGSPSDREVKFAEKIFRRAIAAEPGLAVLQINLGKLLETHLMQFDEAEKAYRMAAKIDANLALPWNRVAELLQAQTTRFVDVEEALRGAIKAEPTDPVAFNNLAWFLYLRHGHVHDAVRFAQQAVRLEPNNVCYMHTLATLLVLTQTWATALPFVRRFIEDAGNQDFWKNDENAAMLFKEIIRIGKANELVSMIHDFVQDDVYWRVLQQALDAIASDDQANIKSIVCNDRHPAHSMLRILVNEN